MRLQWLHILTEFAHNYLVFDENFFLRGPKTLNVRVGINYNFFKTMKVNFKISVNRNGKKLALSCKNAKILRPPH